MEGVPQLERGTDSKAEGVPQLERGTDSRVEAVLMQWGGGKDADLQYV